MVDMNMEVINTESEAIYAEGIKFGVELMIEISRTGENSKRRGLGCKKKREFTSNTAPMQWWLNLYFPVKAYISQNSA